MNKKEKFIIGILLAIIGGTLVITSLVFGIIRVAKGLYTDVASFPVEMSMQKGEKGVGIFTAGKDEIFSFWLKVPDRKIEKQDFNLSISLQDETRETTATWKNNFSFGYMRNSYGEGQYYRLGTHRFNSDFRGKISYVCSGSWIPPYNGTIVARKVTKIIIPLKHINVCLLGALVSLIGIFATLKNKDYLLEINNNSHKSI